MMDTQTIKADAIWVVCLVENVNLTLDSAFLIVIVQLDLILSMFYVKGN
jgi:hypothetical protein